MLLATHWVSTVHAAEGKSVRFTVKMLHKDLNEGDVLLLNDGQITLKVDRIEGTRVHTSVVLGGILSDHKGINRQGGGLSAPALTDTDRKYIKFAANAGMDFLAISFVRHADAPLSWQTAELPLCSRACPIRA